MILQFEPEVLPGTTSIDTDRRSLEDYSSREAIGLLERFCKTSNQDAHGSHPSDQAKWIKPAQRGVRFSFGHLQGLVIENGSSAPDSEPDWRAGVRFRPSRHFESLRVYRSN
jgi:hypothetical protein